MVTSTAQEAYQSLPIVLYPSKREALLYLALSVVLICGGFISLQANVFIGGLCLAFFGLCAAVFIAKLFSSDNYLRLEKDGFAICTFGRIHRVNWDTVQEFVPHRNGPVFLGPCFVGWRSKESYVDSIQGARAARRLTGIDGMLPDNYGMKPKRLAQLMNDLRYCHQLDKGDNDGASGPSNG